MMEAVFLSVIIFILLLLGIMEWLYCRSQKVAGWEAVYYSKRLKRRLLGLGLLLVIVITFFYNDAVHLFMHGIYWNLAYILSSLALVFIVFLLLAKDIMETARYAMRKHAEITVSSLKQFKKRTPQEKPEEEKDAVHKDS
ncbi:hypothetical protein JW926_11735 [Candidatus Sumerlaeota bacterium]|nr:hypothetical protein [Candidatus Sumerlaeota bacterium]